MVKGPKEPKGAIRSQPVPVRSWPRSSKTHLGRPSAIFCIQFCSLVAMHHHCRHRKFWRLGRSPQNWVPSPPETLIQPCLPANNIMTTHYRSYAPSSARMCFYKLVFSTERTARGHSWWVGLWGLQRTTENSVWAFTFTLIGLTLQF